MLGWPLGDTSLRVGASIMLNILGEAGGEEGERRAHELMGRAYAVPGASVHWYGKAGVAAQRKIGHITIVGRDNEECRQRLRAIDPGGSPARGSGFGRGLGGGAALRSRSADCAGVKQRHVCWASAARCSPALRVARPVKHMAPQNTHVSAPAASGPRFMLQRPPMPSRPPPARLPRS